MRLTSFAPLVASVLVVSACSSPAPEPTLYLLRGQPSEGAGRIDAPTRVGLGRVVVAPYLVSSAGIVVETAPGEVRSARQHQWAEPLDAGLRWFLRAEVAKQLGHEVGGALADRADWDYTIDVYVARLHGTMSGTAWLEAAYTIRPATSSGELTEYRFSKSERLADEGYSALVAAVRRLVTGLATAIAQALQDIEAQPQPGAS